MHRPFRYPTSKFKAVAALARFVGETKISISAGLRRQSLCRRIEHLGNLIRRYRFEDGEMTQQQLADLCGVSRQTINAIERNKYSPSLELAFKIVREFGVEIEDIFLYKADPEGESPFQRGAIIEITFENPSGGSTDNESEEL